jgi:hypothetical protein
MRRFEDLEHYGFETDLRGVPVGRAPLGELARAVADGVMTAAEAAAQKAVMAGFIENHVRGPKSGLLIDSATYFSQDDKQTPSATRQWDIELLKAGGVSHESIGKSIRRKVFDAARVLSCEFLLLGEDGSGSLALAAEAKERLYHTVNATRADLAFAVRSQIVAAICDLNSIPKAKRPKVAPAKVEHRKVSDVVDSLAKMAQAGAPLAPDDPSINEVRDLLGLSRVEITAAEIDAMLRAENAAVDDAAAARQPASRPTTAARQDPADDRQTVRDPVEAMKKSLAALEMALATEAA